MKHKGCTTNPKTNKLIQLQKEEIHDSAWVKKQRNAKKKLKKSPVIKRKPQKIVIPKTTVALYLEFLKSEYWKKVRKRVLKRDKHMCKKCKSKFNLQVHHKTYIHHGLEHKYLKDLITLCDICHKIGHKII
jgi:5-methylcytosine-specific restriction endonuclease McrA